MDLKNDTNPFEFIENWSQQRILFLLFCNFLFSAWQIKYHNRWILIELFFNWLRRKNRFCGFFGCAITQRFREIGLKCFALRDNSWCHKKPIHATCLRTICTCTYNKSYCEQTNRTAAKREGKNKVVHTSCSIH